MIVPAKTSEIPEILSLTRACARKMISNGIYQWNEHYPSQEAFQKDIHRGELYVFKKEGKIVGTIVLSDFMDAEYKDIDWLTKNEHNLYIHRLAVHPEAQHQGNARILMDFAQDFAKKSLCPSIRLDTFSQNHRNQRFYEARGYKRLGTIYFPKQSEHPFYCYEKLIEF